MRIAEGIDLGRHDEGVVLKEGDKIVRGKIRSVFSTIIRKTVGGQRMRQKLDLYCVVVHNIEHLPFTQRDTDHLVVHIQNKLDQLVDVVKTPVVAIILQLLGQAIQSSILLIESHHTAQPIHIQTPVSLRARQSNSHFP